LYTHWRADIGGLKPARETRVDTTWRHDWKHINQYTQRYGSSGAVRTIAQRSQRGLKAQAICQYCSALPPQTIVELAIAMGAPANRHVEFCQFSLRPGSRHLVAMFPSAPRYNPGPS
jgi:hypothetical protein